MINIRATHRILFKILSLLGLLSVPAQGHSSPRHSKEPTARRHRDRVLRADSRKTSARRARTRYRVRRGDTLSHIAARHRMTVRQLRRLNRGLRSKLRVGQRLRVRRDRVEVPRKLYPMPGSEHYVIRDPKRAWGSRIAVTRLHQVLTSHGHAFPLAPPLRVHDVSRPAGGYFWPHRSHRRGRDVDVIYPRLPEFRSVHRLSGRMLDLERTWFIVSSLISSGDVEFIFMNYRLQRDLYRYAVECGEPTKQLERIFQYPRGSENPVGIIRHEFGHDAHFHIRFREAVEDLERVG